MKGEANFQQCPKILANLTKDYNHHTLIILSSNQVEKEGRVKNEDWRIGRYEDNAFAEMIDGGGTEDISSGF